MKNRLLALTIITSCALPALPALAQSTAPERGTAAKVRPAPKAAPVVVAADQRAQGRAAGISTVAAAGGLVVLADGIVIGASPAAETPPAPGFVYEQ